MDEFDLSGLDMPEKEKKILKAAIAVFSEKGYSASTTSEIAKNAGVAEGTIFRYYKTKKDILHSILIHFINSFGSKLIFSSIEKILENADEKDLRSLFKELLYDRLKLAESFFPLARIMISEAMFHEDIREALYQSILPKGIKMISTAQEKLKERGLIRSDISSTAMLRSTMGCLASLIAQKLLFNNKTSIAGFESEIDQVIDILLYGLVPRRVPEK
jgi:AcrR family transcriptional regulator